MKQDKNNGRRDFDECSCSGADTRTSENDENSDEWQTIQEEDCCSCCSTSENSKDEGTNTPNQDASNAGLPEQNFPECCQRYSRKEEKKSKAKTTRMRRRSVNEEGQCSRREMRNTSYSNSDCDHCQDDRKRVRDDQELRKRSCSCVGTVQKTGKKRSRIHKRKNRKEKQTEGRRCSCITVVEQQQYCTCPGYSNSSEAQQTPPPYASVDCTECSSASETRYNSVSCQTCQSEDETIMLPRVTLRATEERDRDDCEQCRRERTMFERLSDQNVQSTIDETFKKLIRKTLEMYPAVQRVTQQADNNLNYIPLMGTNVGSLLPQQSSLGMELCTCALKSCNQNGVTYTGSCRECALKSCNQNGVTYTGSCRECAEASTNCTCEECIEFQGNESCEECAKENMESDTCELCVNDETNESCEQCATDSDNNSSDGCCECCKCQCWKNDKPTKDDDFLF